MGMYCTDSPIEQLTPKLRQYIAEHILIRFLEHRKNRDGIVLLDCNLFQDLMTVACNDAANDGLIEDSMRLPLGLLLIQDDDFFTEIRWNLPLPDKAA